MVNLREEGFTFQAICDVLDAEKVKTREGGKWHRKVVRDIINRACEGAPQAL